MQIETTEGVRSHHRCLLLKPSINNCSTRSQKNEVRLPQDKEFEIKPYEPILIILIFFKWKRKRTETREKSSFLKTVVAFDCNHICGVLQDVMQE